MKWAVVTYLKGMNENCTLSVRIYARGDYGSRPSVYLTRAGHDVPESEKR